MSIGLNLGKLRGGGGVGEAREGGSDLYCQIPMR